ncbi:MAG TPA: dihydroorotate dehydrogenase electron transfer subunit [Kiritimatiellia bacterium]|nr:dihydroorotate dehydrogenase electron transfer subunit [Kiritimatiellia bacterium]HMP35287.1 dihydroorotate dehydrogenase electron transfer subunit [Kiritimatiellia bacterium]
MSMYQENAEVLEHEAIQGGYNLLIMRSPNIAPAVKPGQFVHVLVPHLGESILRRPFSVFRAEGDRLAILYKDVGRGTRTLTYLRHGETLSLVGPLGRGFPDPAPGLFPVLVAGGYGMAALHICAQRSPVKGVAFFGGRTAADILCVKEFEALGWTVIVTTEDGSLGHQGRVTDALDPWMAQGGAARKPELFVCGPSGLLKAVAARALEHRWRAWVSVDNNMGCGVGACLTCVLKVHDHEKGDWTWARACREGPVFAASDIVWEAVG